MLDYVSQVSIHQSVSISSLPKRGVSGVRGGVGSGVRRVRIARIGVSDRNSCNTQSKSQVITRNSEASQPASWQLQFANLKNLPGATWAPDTFTEAAGFSATECQMHKMRQNILMRIQTKIPLATAGAWTMAGVWTTGAAATWTGALSTTWIGAANNEHLNQ